MIILSSKYNMSILANHYIGDSFYLLILIHLLMRPQKLKQAVSECDVIILITSAMWPNVLIDILIMFR